MTIQQFFSQRVFGSEKNSFLKLIKNHPFGEHSIRTNYNFNKYPYSYTYYALFSICFPKMHLFGGNKNPSRLLLAMNIRLAICTNMTIPIHTKYIFSVNSGQYFFLIFLFQTLYCPRNLTTVT